MELLKDYDVIIQYHPCKENMVADTLRQNTVIIGSLACLGVSKQPLSTQISTWSVISCT